MGGFFFIFYYMWPGLLPGNRGKAVWNDRSKEGEVELGTTPNVAQDVRIPITPHVAIAQRRIAHDDPSAVAASNARRAEMSIK